MLDVSDSPTALASKFGGDVKGAMMFSVLFTGQFRSWQEIMSMLTGGRSVENAL